MAIDTECWNVRSDGNYETVRLFNGRTTEGWLAHRVAWAWANGSWDERGPAIPQGMVVMHSCDNRSCANPAHLSLGTQSQNIKDAIAKGRHTRSWTTANNPRTRFTAEQVKAIRECAGNLAELARNLGINYAYALKIKQGKRRSVA